MRLLDPYSAYMRRAANTRRFQAAFHAENKWILTAVCEVHHYQAGVDEAN